MGPQLFQLTVKPTHCHTVNKLNKSSNARLVKQVELQLARGYHEYCKYRPNTYTVGHGTDVCETAYIYI